MNSTAQKQRIRQIQHIADTAQQLHRRDPAATLELCLEIEELSQRYDYRRGIALAEMCRGNALFVQGKYPKAEEAFTRALEIYERSRDKNGRAKALAQLAGVALFRGEYKQAISAAVRAMEFAKELQDSSTEATAMTTLGNIYVSAGEVQRGIYQLENALQMYEELGDTARCCGTMHNLSMAYSAAGNREKQRELLEKSNALWRSFDDPYGLAISSNGLAAFYADMQDLQKAMHYAEESIALQRSVGNENGIAEATLNHALSLIRSGNTRKAISISKEAIETFEKLGHRRFACNGLQTLAFAYYTARNKRKAYDTLTQALAIATDLGARQDVADICSALTAICTEWNDWKNAMHFQEEYYRTLLVITRMEQERSSENAELIRFAEEALRQAELQRNTSEQLRQLMKKKERELERATLDFARAKEFLAALKERITEARYASHRSSQRMLDSIISELHRYGRSQESWSDFMEQFDEVHDGFVLKLRSLHPSISPMEIKLCTLLKLRLASKDIASVLNISLRTVENHRLRLRKKLDLPAHTTLSGYLESL